MKNWKHVAPALLSFGSLFEFLNIILSCLYYLRFYISAVAYLGSQLIVCVFLTISFRNLDTNIIPELKTSISHLYNVEYSNVHAPDTDGFNILHAMVIMSWISFTGMLLVSSCCICMCLRSSSKTSI